MWKKAYGQSKKASGQSYAFILVKKVLCPASAQRKKIQLETVESGLEKNQAAILFILDEDPEL